MKQNYSFNMSGLQTVNYAEDLLRELFESIPAVSEISSLNSSGIETLGDIFLSIELSSGKEIRIIAEVKTNGEKRYIRNFIKCIENNYSNIYFVFIAPYISPTSVKLCYESNIGFLDFCGNCFFSVDSLYIHVEGKPNKYIQKRENRNILNRSSEVTSKILRTMLNEYEKVWQVKKLSEICGVGIGTVFNVKKYLLNNEWCISENEGFKLCNIDEMLLTWSAHYNKIMNSSYEYYSLDSISEIEEKLASLDKNGILCTLASYSAAARYAPTVRYNKVHAYVQYQDIDEIVKLLELKKVNSGGNLALIIPHSEIPCMYSKKKKNINVTSPVQTVLDLLAHKGRGEEAADAIIRKEFKL